MARPKNEVESALAAFQRSIVKAIEQGFASVGRPERAEHTETTDGEPTGAFVFAVDADNATEARRPDVAEAIQKALAVLDQEIGILEDRLESHTYRLGPVVAPFHPGAEDGDGTDKAVHSAPLVEWLEALTSRVHRSAEHLADLTARTAL